MATKKTRKGVHKVKGGYVVENGKGHKFSKKPQTKAKADAQLRAIEYGMHKRGKGLAQ